MSGSEEEADEGDSLFLVVRSEEGRAEKVRRLLSCLKGTGAIAGPTGAEALRGAVLAGNEAVVEAFLETAEGRDAIKCKAKCSLGDTALHAAARIGSAAMVGRFLQVPQGKEALLIQDALGRTPLMYAVCSPKDTDLVANTILATNEGFRTVPWCDINGGTALLYACSMGRALVVEAILEHPELGALLRKAHVSGETPLQVAICRSHMPAARAILQSQEGKKLLLDILASDQEDSDEDEYDQEHIAWAILEDDEGVKSLLERDENGQTALHIAAKKGLESTVQLILSKELGKKLISKEDKNGKTAKDLAKENNDWTIIELIEDCIKEPSAAPIGATQNMTIQGNNISVGNVSNSATRQS